MVEYFYNKSNHDITNTANNESFINCCITNKNVKALEFLDKKGFIITPTEKVRAITSGSLECLKYMEEVKNPKIEWNNSVKLFPMYLDLVSILETLKYAMENGFSCDLTFYDKVITTNNLDLFKLIHRTKPFNHYINNLCNFLAEYGNLHLLIYAHENGAPFEDNICDKAYKNGHIDCVKYILSTGFIWNIEEYENSLKTIKNLIKESKN